MHGNPAPIDPDFERTVRTSFSRQGLMTAFRARIERIEPGHVAISAPVADEFSQQDGFPHAGFGWSLGDSAAGYAALTLMAPGERVLTAEMKTNLLAPAVGKTVVAEGRVLRFGKRLCTVQADIFAADDARCPERIHVAIMLGTMVRMTAAGV